MQITANYCSANGFENPSIKIEQILNQGRNKITNILKKVPKTTLNNNSYDLKCPSRISSKSKYRKQIHLLPLNKPPNKRRNNNLSLEQSAILPKITRLKYNEHFVEKGTRMSGWNKNIEEVYFDEFCDEMKLDN